MQQKLTKSFSKSFSDSENSIELEGLEDLNLNDDNNQNIDNIDQIIADIQKATLKQNIQQNEQIIIRETINEFICNFLIKNQFDRSLEAFQEEWLMLQKKNQMNCNNIGFIPDIYIQFEKLQDEIQFLKGELERTNLMVENMQSSIQKLVKSNNFHKLNFKKSQLEKKQLQIEIDKLKQMLQLEIGEALKQSQFEQTNQEEIKSIKKKILFKNSSIMSQIQKDEEQSQLKESLKQGNRLPIVQNKGALQNIIKQKK